MINALAKHHGWDVSHLELAKDHELAAEYGKIAEVSDELRNRYVDRATSDHGHANFAARASKSHPGLEKYSKEQERRAEKRKAGLGRALSDKRLGREVDEIAGAFPSPSTRAKWAADAAASNAAEAKRQEQLKAQQLQKNTAEVEKQQKINHHSLAPDTVPPVPANEGEVVKFPKKHKGDLENTHDCPKCGGDLQGGKYMGHQVKVCMPCKQVYLPPNSGIDQQGNKIKDEGFDYTMKDMGNDYAGFPSNHSMKHKMLKRISPEYHQLYKDKMNNTHDWDSLFNLFKVAKGRGHVIDEVAMRMQGSSQSEKDANARAKAREAEEKAKHAAIVKAYVDIMSKGQLLPPKMQQSYNTMPDFKKEVDAELQKIPGRPGEVDLLQRQNHHLLTREDSEQRKQNALWAQISAYEKKAKNNKSQNVTHHNTLIRTFHSRHHFPVK
jgi:hypothetical protein